MKKIFETQRLVVQEFTEVDWTSVYVMNTSWDVIKNIGDGKIKSMELERKGFEKILNSYSDAGLGVWAVLTKVEQEFIGAASLTALSGTADIQLGYRFKKEFWG